MKILVNFFELRLIPKESQIIYDTFIFFVEDINKRKKIIKLLNERKIGTKNLPDAIEWHCSYYWGHMLNKTTIKSNIKSKNILLKAIAIPISLKKDLRIYKLIANDILKIK